MRVFIIRPFGEKAGIDFDRVESELIQPALKQLGRSDMEITGSTTELVTKQGNIREDMFRLIAVADLVIADISIHNANVFYELGMRHALKPRYTFMIRSKTGHDYPFDLETDRYFSYEAGAPQASVTTLAQAIRASLASDKIDSPMFALLPDLIPHGRRQLVNIPTSFQEDVDHARVGQEDGKLRLFAYEARAFEWDQEGLRLVGDAQFKLRAFTGARDTFELLRQTEGAHVNANLRLGTIYQRLAHVEPAARKAELMTRSAQAIQRVIDAAVTNADVVEAHCLLASNEKSRWVDELKGLSTTKQQAASLRSVHFDRMLQAYLRAANLDLNAHYAAINALAGLKIQSACARARTRQWLDMHEDEVSATRRLTAIEKLIGHLTANMHLSLELDGLMGKRVAEPDPWTCSSRADFLLMTAYTSPERVAQAYRAVLAGDDWFALDATKRNVNIFKTFGLFEPGVSAALRELEGAAASGKSSAKPSKVLMFTGHMVDRADQPEAQRRFPRTCQATLRARTLIREAVQAELACCDGIVLGIAGGACGGDILFHEVCAEFGITTLLYLALPPEQFEVSSVQHGGPGWVQRYRAILRRCDPYVLQATEALPAWLTEKPNYSLWERNNLWMMFSAMSIGAADLTLLALYNWEREPHGPGGTLHLLERSKKNGFKAVELDAHVLLVP